MTKQNAKRVVLPDDSERMIPEYHKGKSIYGEHIVRYQSAQELVRGKVVLDIASGSGYGTKLLSKTAKKVYGVDVSEISVAYANENYGAKNIEYLVGDGEKIPLPDKSVDVVTTFETIEHIPDYRQFMKEVSRVLKDDGLAVISTPNDLEFAEGNHFHLHEFEYNELLRLIKKHFRHVSPYFQGTWVYNALVDEAMLSREQTFTIETMNSAPIPVKKCIYFYVLASNRAIKEKVKPVAAIAEHWSARTIKQDFEKLYHKQQLSDNHIANLNAIITKKQDEVKALKKELNAIHESRAWKTTQKLRKIRRLGRG